MKKTVILLGGPQGSGKTDAAGFIGDTLTLNGFSTIVLRFADTIKELHDMIEPRFAKAANIPAKKKNGTLLQKLGTEIGRNIYGKDIWVNLTHDRIKSISGQAEQSRIEYDSEYVVIVEDVRFENELNLQDTLEQEGYQVISIYFDCPLEIRKVRVEDFREDTSHQSESELEKIKDKFKFTVNTSGNISDKQKAISAILKASELLIDPKKNLEMIVEMFNSELATWSASNNYGANFEWRYQPDGKKVLVIKDCSEISTLPKDKAAVAVVEVQNFMEKLDEQPKI